MAKKKKEQKVSISQGDEAQAQAVLERYHKLAGELRSSKDQNQAEEAVSTVSDLPEAAQMALLKALSREYHQDAADVLVGINALSPLKSVRKEARRSLLRLEEARIYPRWEPPIERLSPVDAMQMQAVNSKVTDLMAVIEESENQPRFWKGFVTDSRDIGEVDLLLMWEQGDNNKEVIILGFLLELWHDGIKDFFSRVEARRLIKEALAVNERFGTPIYKDFRASLPLVNKLILENPDIVDEDEEDEEEEYDEEEIDPDLKPIEVVTNFIEDWADQEYMDAYNYLASQSRLRQGRTCYLSYHKQPISTKKLDATGSGQATNWLKSRVDGEYLIWLTRGRMRRIFPRLNYKGSLSNIMSGSKRLHSSIAPTIPMRSNILMKFSGIRCRSCIMKMR